MGRNKDEALRLLTEAKTAVLSVIDFETSFPMGSLVNIAAGPDGLPLLFISSLARHHKCLLKDSRASLLVWTPSPDGDPLAGFRAAFQGPMQPAENSSGTREAYVSKHPYAESYMEFGDFSFWQMKPQLVHVVAGFGRIETIRL